MIIHTDASEIINKETGDPICAVHSVIVYDDNYRFIKKVTNKSFSKGITQAEGTSILMAISIAEKGATIKTDSKNIVNGNSSEGELIKLLCEEKEITLEWIPREKNTHADLICHQERNEVIKSHMKAGVFIVNKPRKTQKIEQLKNILKVGEVVEQTDVKVDKKVAVKIPTLSKYKEVVVKVTSKENKVKEVTITKVINNSIFNLLECSDNDELNISKTIKRNEMVKLFKATYKRVIKKVENNEPLDGQDIQCLEGIKYLSMNKKRKLEMIKEVCYPKYLERSNGLIPILECEFITLAKKHMKYVVGTKKSFNALINNVINEVANR